MSDPLSIAGSVVGIVSLGIQATQSLYNVYKANKNRQTDCTSTASRLEKLLELLSHLDRQLNSGELGTDRHRLIEGYIRQCEDCIYELQEENEKFRDELNNKKDVVTVARTVARRAAYPFRKSTLEKLNEDVDEIVSHLSLAVQVLQQKDLFDIKSETKAAKTLLECIKDNQLSSAIREWLEPPDAFLDLNSARKKRTVETGRWLIDGTPFLEWVSSPGSLLWLYGFAGCGKSVLCSTAIEYVLNQQKGNPSIAVAFFFFRFDGQQKQNVSGLLRALVWQLSAYQNDKHGTLSRFYESHKQGSLTEDLLLDCLIDIAKTLDTVHIIIDALDESPREKHRGEVLQILCDLKARIGSNAHFLVTSRDEVDIREVFELDLCVSETMMISMETTAVEADIASFVSHSLKHNRQLRRWSKYHEHIQSVLSERAKGV